MGVTQRDGPVPGPQASVPPKPQGSSPVHGSSLACGFAWTVVPQHGRRPMAFWGRLLLQAAHREPGLPVWSDLALHESEGGEIVAAMRHVLRGRDGAADGPPLCYAVASRSAAALRQALAAHDPMADLPAESLLGAAHFEDPYAAGLLAERLRAAWRALLAASFGDPAAPPPTSRASWKEQP